jgi:hypothetical protein
VSVSTIVSELLSVGLQRMKIHTKYQNFLNQVRVTHIKDVINRFVQAGNTNKGKTTGRLPKSEEAVEN